MNLLSLPALQRAAFALAWACTAAVPALAADPSEFSAAEKLVFTEAHLGNVKPPAGLRYSYVRTATAKDTAFEDDALIDVTASGKSCCTVHGRFLSGSRQLAQLPDIVDAKSNPIILYFLENDIREMAKETKRRDGGGYFRNRIRKAMVDEAAVKDITVEYQGKKLPAQEVTLSPYLKDPARARYERLATKRYSFVLAKGVPGGVYQVSTVLPGALATDAPVQQDMLTLVGPVAPGAATAAAAAATAASSPDTATKK